VEIIVGLLIGTVLVMGWFIGSPFVGVFLSLPVVGFMLFDTQAFSRNISDIPGIVAVLAVIWLPSLIRHAVRT